MIPPSSPTGDYYVIVGNGFAAILDHLTLLESGRLNGKPPVVHIGGPDPWSLYYPHRMGQWPCLLTLPGYSFHPAAAAEWDFADAAAFAQANSAQARKLGLVTMAAEVRGIELDDGGAYRVDTSNGIIRAAHVDVCGGAGPPRALNMPGDLTAIVPAERYLEQATVERAGRVCVLGGGPTSAWCVERALLAKNEVAWAARDTLHGAFVASGRNDHLLRGPVQRVRQHGRLVAAGELSPGDPSLTLMPFTTVSRVRQEQATGKVELTLSSVANPLVFDQVVVSFGQQREWDEPASWARMLDALIPAAGPLAAYEIADASGRTAGLQSKDGRVRLLGSAALNHPLIDRALHNLPPPASPMPAIRRLAHFERSLPDQAGGGVALAAVLIASANGYFGANPNRNLNTADLPELEALLGETAARTHYTLRANSIHPFVGTGDRYPTMP